MIDQDSQDDVARLESERGQVVKWGRQKLGGEARGNTCFVDPLAETQALRSLKHCTVTKSQGQHFACP